MRLSLRFLLFGGGLACLWLLLAFLYFEGTVKSRDRRTRISSILEKVNSMAQDLQTFQGEALNLKKRINGLLLSDKNAGEPVDSVIPVLMFTCNRVSVSRALDLLIKYRTDPLRHPIIVSQDCGHKATANVIRSYGSAITYIAQPDTSDIKDIPKKEIKFKGYYKIARHYGWALNYVFNELKANQVIIVEDDLEVAPDFYEYFDATLPILKKDPTLWCVSAWNDNGKEKIIDSSDPSLLHRTDFFGGLGWMITKDIWINELSIKWPRSFWDDWMRHPNQRKERACIRPEISRTKTFGKIGVSNGLFFDKHLKFILLNSQFVSFSKMNLTRLLKENYDAEMSKRVNDAALVDILDLKNDHLLDRSSKPLKVIYKTRKQFVKIAKVLGIMDDFRSGVPRMAYNGVISTMYNRRRVFVSPGSSWKGYNPSW